MSTYQITAPHFTAGFTDNRYGVITTCAPILGWTKNKKVDNIKAYCFSKGWKIEQITETAETDIGTKNGQ